MKKILLRTLRIIIALAIITLLTLGFIFYPITTTSIVAVVLVGFVWTEIPYRIIAHIFRFIKKANYVCIVLPYADKFITIRKKGYIDGVSDRMKRHEEDHIKYFNERWATIQCTIYIAFLIWYGYYDNPIEVRARRAENG